MTDKKPEDFAPLLVSIARFLYGEIEPCGWKDRPWSECITDGEGRVQLWFNDKTHSTRLVTIQY